MNGGFRIMRIRGIDVKIDWSLLIIGVFISMSLATGYFPALLPDWGGFVYLTAALVSFVGLYASVLLHELAHSFVAQKQGLKVESIVLNLFGGVSNLKQETRSPRAEFWLAVVGPLTSLVLAGVFFGVGSLLGPANPAIGAIAGYLFLINFLLGVFNLLPAYPLDGGRVLRAFVWGWTKNEVKATRAVARIGRGFGWGFVALGFGLILLGDLFDGLWMMLIGWFLNNAAKAEYAQTVTIRNLQGMTVGQAMWPSDRVISPEVPLNSAGQAFFGVERGRVLPVVEQGYLLGVLSLEQFRKTPPAEWGQLRVVDVMTRRGSLLAFRPEDDLQQALETMAAKPAFYAAVIGEGGQFAGLLYLSDIPRLLEMQQILSGTDQSGESMTRPASETGKDGRDNSQPTQPHELDKVA